MATKGKGCKNCGGTPRLRTCVTRTNDDGVTYHRWFTSRFCATCYNRAHVPCRQPEAR
jgi:hypothetical protein